MGFLLTFFKKYDISFDMFEVEEKDFSVREFVPGDYDSLKGIASRINEMARLKKGYFPFYAFQEHAGENKTLGTKVSAFLKKAFSEREALPRATHRLAVCDALGRLIGNVTVDMIPSIDSNGKATFGDLGYFIDPIYGGCGLMTKAVRHVLTRYFQTFDRLDVTVHPENMFSRRLILSLGGKEEGLLSRSSYAGEPRAVFVVTRSAFFETLRRVASQKEKSCLAMRHYLNQRSF